MVLIIRSGQGSALLALTRFEPCYTSDASNRCANTGPTLTNVASEKARRWLKTNVASPALRLNFPSGNDQTKGEISSCCAIASRKAQLFA
jgi:hypothetical protein